MMIQGVLCAQWIQHGPGPSTNGQVENITDREVVGAVNCVAPHPTNADILYIGAVNGGVWSTTNATSTPPTWTFISGDLPSQAIGALEFDPTDATFQTLVAGIGRTSSLGSFGAGPRGVFRTTTGADPWTNIDGGGIFTTRNITGVAARGATIVVASTVGGVWRTTNTGTNWVQLSGGAGTGLPAGNAFDLVSDPGDNAILYVNAGTTGIYKSTNTGADWTKVSDAALDAALVGAGNIEMAVGNNDNVYVAIVRGGRLGSLFRSGDGGGNWTALDVPGTIESGVTFGIHPGGQGNTHLSIAADPADDNVVYVGGDRQVGVDEANPEANPALPRWPNSIGAQDYSGRLFRVDASLAAGTQATPITNNGTASSSSPHADSRDMDFDANGQLIESDDGGVYKQTSPGDATGDWFSMIGNLSVTEVHSSDWDSNAKIVITGAQDNGTPQQQFPSNSRWRSISTADGGDVCVDDYTSSATSVRYSSSQFLGSFRRSVWSSGNVLQSQTFPALTNTATGNRITGLSFITPIKLNSQNGLRLLIATTDSLFESADQGNTCTSIGTFSVNNLGANALAYGATDNAEIIYAGAGNTVRIRNAAAPAAFTTSTTYAGANVQGLTIDPDDSQSAYVIDANNVFETTTQGVGNWTNITGNLQTLNPGILRSIAYITTDGEDMLAVGSDFGVFVSPGPAFNNWVRLGANLPLAQVFSLVYDRTDQILLAGTLGRGTWTFNFSDREPVDVALVLDLSGSMLSPACPTCDSRLEVLKDAVEIFMQLWKGMAIADDRIMIKYFRTNIDGPVSGGSPLFPVITGTDGLIDDVRSQITDWSQMTAMGGGLQSAINELTDADPLRNIILFTDGMQNVNPGVVYPSLQIQGGVYSINSNISATSPPTTLDNALNIKVSTIGVGATSAFESQLADIANGTNGLTKITTAPDEELRRFFVEELVDALRNFSPQLVAYRKGQLNDVANESFSINSTARRVVFKISYGRADRVSISIRKGKMDVTQWAFVTHGPFYQIFSFPFERLMLFDGPEYDGPWTVQLGGRAAMYEIAAIADEVALKYHLAIDKAPFRTGSSLDINAKIFMHGDLIVDDISVTARIRRPGQGLGTLLSKTKMPTGSMQFEPNLPPGARKLALIAQQQSVSSLLNPVENFITLTPDESKIFRAEYGQTAIPGSYKVEFLIKGTNPLTGPFERIEERTAVLRFSQFNLDASNVRTTKRPPDTDGLAVWTWTFIPKDRFGNFLGPDYSDVMVIQSADGEIRNITDAGDGSYTFEIASPVDRPRVKIGLYDEIWFDDQIPLPQGPALYASLHAGIPIPVGNFANDFNPGFYLKLDLEMRLRNNHSVQAAGGLYSFREDLQVGFGVIQYKKYLPISQKFDLYGEIGPGVYFFSNSDNYFGFDLGTGLNYRLSSRSDLSFNVNYVSLIDHPSDFRWFGLGIGFHFKL